MDVLLEFGSSLYVTREIRDWDTISLFSTLLRNSLLTFFAPVAPIPIPCYPLRRSSLCKTQRKVDIVLNNRKKKNLKILSSAATIQNWTPSCRRTQEVFDFLDTSSENSVSTYNQPNLESTQNQPSFFCLKFWALVKNHPRICQALLKNLSNTS
jgi:hypothetical protein